MSDAVVYTILNNTGAVVCMQDADGVEHNINLSIRISLTPGQYQQALAIFGAANISQYSTPHNQPYSYTNLPPAQYNLACNPAIILNVPDGAIYATVTASQATVRYTTDGNTTPTANIGIALLPGATVPLQGSEVILNFQAYSVTGLIDVEYYK